MRYVTLSSGIAKLGSLESLGFPGVRRIGRWSSSDGETLLVWGRKPSTRRAMAYALKHRVDVVCLEDGFLRSVDLGHSSTPLSIVVDAEGVYYDAQTASSLEALARVPLDAAAADRAAAIAAAWRGARVSKYNHQREYSGPLPTPYVLVADQTRGDASVQFGFADAGAFVRMLDAALDEHPGCTVVVKVHPDVVAGKKRGYFDVPALKKMPRIVVVADDAHPAGLIEQADAVYVVTSQIGFEGLLWGKPVRTFGMPFYAGWGFTSDELSAPGRRTPVPFLQFVHAALVKYPRYLDPETGERCEVERLIDWIGLQRRMRDRFPPRVYATGFSRWKRPFVRQFLQGSHVKFVPRSTRLPEGSTLAVWGGAGAGRVFDAAHILRLEDGFLRSVGLGAGLVRPLSWVQDTTGIYYDSTRPSDLEILLQTAEVDESMLRRAQALRTRIVDAGITKYNLQGGGWTRPAYLTPSRGPVILVPGQVESDASLALGAPDIKTNIALLRAVRAAHPSAYVVFKPHPDVVAGYRLQGPEEAAARQWCDEIVTDSPMATLLDGVDEVHTLTSLTGFEALMRGKRVTCHGQPFYAGWGLTADKIPLLRRSRRLTVDQLIAITLIAYPAYTDPSSGAFATPERAVVELVRWRDHSQGAARWWSRPLAWMLRLRRR